MAGLGLLALRLTLASILVAHGAHTLFGAWAGPGIGPGGIAAEAAAYAALGLQPATTIVTVSGVLQLLGGALLTIGFLTRWASLLLLADVGLGVWKIQWPWGFFLNYTDAAGRGHGLEYGLLMAGALVCLVLAGAGEWSVDGVRNRSAATRAAGRARLRGKV